ncbi:MAG: cytochrome c3 family protein [Nitrospirota bacterium]
MGGAQKIVTIGGSAIPQVYHTDTLDLAGGNFAYITTPAKRVTADGNSAGHNVVALGQNETILFYPPGSEFHSPGGTYVSRTNLRCAGKNGCHGTRVDNTKTELQQLKGSHHKNVDGKCDTATENYNSYRFLRGVKGLENTGTYKWQNYNSTNHNEYYGAITPMSSGACASCHGAGMAAMPANKTISGFCGTCHGNFHSLEGIGGNTSSPFTRHPTDIVLKGSGEYVAYTTYSIQAPVARPTVYDTPSSVVTPGTDVVMCLSCHAAHATPYADILKWDYSAMVAGGGGSGGCFTCHTQKKNPP